MSAKRSQATTKSHYGLLSVKCEIQVKNDKSKITIKKEKKEKKMGNKYLNFTNLYHIITITKPLQFGTLHNSIIY